MQQAVFEAGAGHLDMVGELEAALKSARGNALVENLGADVALGLLIYFASQGAGTILWAFLAGTLRLLIAAVIGWIAVTRFHASLGVLFALVAVSSVAYAAICAAALMRAGWGKARA